MFPRPSAAVRGLTVFQRRAVPAMPVVTPYATAWNGLEEKEGGRERRVRVCAKVVGKEKGVRKGGGGREEERALNEKSLHKEKDGKG